MKCRSRLDSSSSMEAQFPHFPQCSLSSLVLNSFMRLGRLLQDAASEHRMNFGSFPPFEIL
ncbi:Type III pantothenate kinase, partial [Clarias magur]